MRGEILRSWLAVMLLAVPGVAEEAPKAVLVGPAAVNVGAMAVIRTEGSIGKNFRWLVLPKEAESWFLPVFLDIGNNQQQRAGILVPAASGTIFIAYVATQADQSDIATLVVNPGQSPTPIPTPETNPYAPAEAYKAAVQPMLTCKAPRADASAVAAVYKSLAGDVAAGAIKTNQALRAAIVARYQALGFGGKYAQTLGAAADRVFAAALGDQAAAAVDPSKVGPLLTTMAWATWETGR